MKDLLVASFQRSWFSQVWTRKEKNAQATEAIKITPEFEYCNWAALSFFWLTLKQLDKSLYCFEFEWRQLLRNGVF